MEKEKEKKKKYSTQGQNVNRPYNYQLDRHIKTSCKESLQN